MGNWVKFLLSKAEFFPPPSPSHQEAYTCLVASSTRGQTEEARRTTVPQQLGPKPHHRDLTMMKRFRPR